MNVHFTARLPAEVMAKVQKRAKEKHTTATAVVIDALERYFSDQDARLERVEKRLEQIYRLLEGGGLHEGSNQRQGAE